MQGKQASGLRIATHTEKTERIRSGVAKKIATKSIIEKTVLIQAVDLKQRTPIPVKKKKTKKKTKTKTSVA